MPAARTRTRSCGIERWNCLTRHMRTSTPSATRNGAAMSSMSSPSCPSLRRHRSRSSERCPPRALTAAWHRPLQSAARPYHRTRGLRPQAITEPAPTTWTSPTALPPLSTSTSTAALLLLCSRSPSARADHHAFGWGDQDGDPGQRQRGHTRARPVTSRCPHEPPLGGEGHSNNK